MPWPVLLSFLTATLVVQLVPGPGMLFIIANGISGGPRAGIAAACGAAAGMVVHTLAAALGLAALFERAPAAYDVLRVGGAAYLLWLAASHFRAGREGKLATGPAGRSLRQVFIRGSLNNLSNPKVILFYIAFLPEFVSPGGAPVTVQLLVLGSVFLVLGLAIDLVLGTFAGRIGEWLRHRTRVRRGIEWSAGTILGALGIRLLVSGRH